MVLDCQSVASIYHSLKQACDVDEAAMESAFYNLSLNLSHFDCISSADLLSEVISRVGTDLTFEATCWFHLGRTVANTSFEEGILPLGEAAEQIWKMLFGLLHNFPKKEWLEFRIGMEKGFSRDDPGVRDYRSKMSDPRHWGPYAYLILEAAYYDYGISQTLTRYWTAPEVIENICLCFKHKYSISLIELFEQSSQPFVAKFTDDWQRKHLEDAIRYLYFAYHDKKSQYRFNPVFNGHAKKVKPERIIDYWFIEL